MNKSKSISWMPLFVIAAAAFVGALDATFMNVSMSQVVIDRYSSEVSQRQENQWIREKRCEEVTKIPVPNWTLL